MFIMKVSDRYLAAELACHFVAFEVKFDFEYILTKESPTGDGLGSEGYEKFTIHKDEKIVFDNLESEFSISINAVGGQKRYGINELDSQYFSTFAADGSNPNSWDLCDGKSFWLIERSQS